MKLFLLTALTMTAFAANSVLNRLALADGAMGPASFAAVRLVSGAVVLVFLAQMRRGSLPWTTPGRWLGVASLALYVLGFSFAYVSLEAGVGALILFGGVQITMFAGAVCGGAKVAPRRWAGAGLAFVGLAYLLWPVGGAAPSAMGAILMGAAALGWGVYSLIGSKVQDPLAQTAVNFAWAAPLAVVLFIALPDQTTGYGVVLACVSGIVTSGLGYALWYAVLPRIETSVAAIAQLSVPLIALAGGIMFLGEAMTLRFGIACILVLGGILLGLSAKSVPADRK